jgi:hypothetical protein
VSAADCAERVLGLFEAEAPGDSRPRDAIARLRAFSRGELGVAEAHRRFVAHAAAREVSAPAAVAAARAAGQAASLPHMGAHALGAAAYAAKAAGLAAPDRPEAVSEEIRWQLGRMSAAARAALRQLPPVGENASGPLGPGLLASGLLGTIIRDLQASLADPCALRSASHSTPPLLAPIRTVARRQCLPPALAPAQAPGWRRVASLCRCKFAAVQVPRVSLCGGDLLVEGVGVGLLVLNPVGVLAAGVGERVRRCLRPSGTDMELTRYGGAQSPRGRGVDGQHVETLEDLLQPGLRAVCVGINPAPRSVRAGHYYQGNLGQRLFSRLSEAEVLPPGRGG